MSCGLSVICYCIYIHTDTSDTSYHDKTIALVHRSMAENNLLTLIGARAAWSWSITSEVLQKPNGFELTRTAWMPAARHQPPGHVSVARREDDDRGRAGRSQITFVQEVIPLL